MTSKKILLKTIKDSPLFWWFRPFYNSPLFMDGYRVSYNYVGVTENMLHCAEEIKEAIEEELESMTDKEFENHPSFQVDVGSMEFTFYVGGPGSDPPPPPPLPKGGG